MGTSGERTVSTSPNTTLFFSNKKAAVQFVNVLQRNFPVTYPSITTTLQEKYGGSCVLTVTDTSWDVIATINSYYRQRTT
jgi:hypothetical protein